MRVAKCPFLNPANLFCFRDAVDKKNNYIKQRINKRIMAKSWRNVCQKSYEVIILFYFLSPRVSRALCRKAP